MIQLLKRLWEWFKYREPAELNALKTTVLGLLATFGVTLGTDVEAEIGFWVGVAVVVLTQVQAILTRFGVFAPATVQQIEQEASRG